MVFSRHGGGFLLLKLAPSTIRRRGLQEGTDATRVEAPAQEAMKAWISFTSRAVDV